jgi:hypothetical protein
MSTTPDSKGASDIGTSPVDVYTVPATPAKSTVVGWIISNKKANQITVSAYWVDASTATTYTIVEDAPIPAGGSIVPVDSNKLNLQYDDKLQVVASEANACDSIVSYLQS